MNPFKSIKNHFINSLKKNFSLAIYAIIIAILAWFVISMTIYPSVPKTIFDIPVSIDISGTSAADNGLSVISCDIEKVNVKVLGSRAQIGNLNNENITAKIFADNVNSAGSKTLDIKISSDSNIAFDVQSISPATANVVFDKYEEREFAISPKITNISFADGKTINNDEFTCKPDVIKITGPSAQLDNISKCVAVSNKEAVLDSSYSLANDEIQLFSEDGTLIDQKSLKFDTSNFIINIPVLTQKTVDLSVAIVNAPATFNKDCLKFKMSADSITIASKSNQSEIPDKLEIGQIMLSELDLGFTKTFSLSNTLQDTGCINMSNLDAVTVTLDDETLASKDLTLNQFSISNPPDTAYEYKVLTQKLDVKIVGPKDIIDDITASDIVADINLLNAEIQTDSFTYSITLSCPKYDNVWAVTNSKASIQRTEKAKITTSTLNQ